MCSGRKTKHGLSVFHKLICMNWTLGTVHTDKQHTLSFKIHMDKVFYYPGPF